MQHKHLLAQLLEHFLKPEYVGVEIGIDKAETTLYLLEHCKNLKQLYAIDPYIKRDGRHETVTEQLSEFDNVTLIRKKSEHSLSDIPDKIDFVFIDGDHSFKGVKKDLEKYVPLIKSNGLLTGHDWTTVRTAFGVVQACGEYFIKNEKLFKPLFTNEELKEQNLEDFKCGGWNEKAQRCLIHKKRPSAFPLWWLIKA